MESTSDSTVANSDTNNTNDIKSGNSDKSVVDPKKSIADHDLKNSIIEFMRVRPFLWNCRDPSYKDHKRRDQEFQEFSNQIQVPVREIKRVWHVLRTNFFRAHKLLIDRPNYNHTGSGENGGERLWKYYLAMEYILGGINNGSIDDSHMMRHVRNRDCKASRDGRTNSISSKPNYRELNNSARAGCKLTNNSGSSGGGASLNNSFSSITTNIKSTLPNNNNNINNNNNNNEFPASSLTTIMDSDDDHLYARSLTSTLKKFDPTTKEIIKLKFQQIIVSYMRQSQSQQLTNEATTNSDGNEDVPLFNSK